MKVLVTGANGFIGRHVVARLREDGYEPMTFDRRRDVDTDYLGDATNAEHVHEAMAHAEGFIHLAAILGTQETISSPRTAVTANVAMGLNVLEAAHRYNLPGVYIGVGNHWMNNPYSISKTTVERLVYMYQNEHDLRVNVVRCVNAYGPGQVPATPYGPSKVRKIMPAFICRALAGDPIEVYGDGEQISDCVYVTDVARVLVAAFSLAKQGEVRSQAIEVGPVEHMTVNEVAKTVRSEVWKQTGATTAIVHLPMRPGEEAGAVVTADLTTLNGTGVAPTSFVPLDEGIANTVRWLVAEG